MPPPIRATAWVFTTAGAPLEQHTVDVDVDALADGTALVAVDFATICGSDLHTISGAAQRGRALGVRRLSRVARAFAVRAH